MATAFYCACDYPDCECSVSVYAEDVVCRACRNEQHDIVTKELPRAKS